MQMRIFEMERCNFMDNNRQVFSYDECMRKVNRIISPNKKQLPPICDKNDTLLKVNEVIREYNLPILYRYMPLSLNALASIMNEVVYLVPAIELNDVFEGAAYGMYSYSPANDQEEINRIQRGVYLKSFSCAKNDNMMWSHYGDSHKGICIGYDFSRAKKNILKHLYPVQYSDTRFSNLSLNNVEASPFLYLRKSKCWEREKEFRLIYEKRDLESGESVDNKIELRECIKEIWFGLRTKIEEKRLITNMLEGEVELYETKYDISTFSLGVERLNRQKDSIDLRF